VTRAREKANLTQKITTSEPTQLTNGMIWLDTDAVAVSQQSMRWTKTPSGGTTVLSGASDTSITLSYSTGQEQVYANGVLLIRGSDYTASDGTSITLASASVAGDVFEVISIIPLTLVDTYTQAQADGKFVNNTLADAKGDLVVGTADNVISKIAAGSNGQSLVADSTTTSGLRWQDNHIAGKNKIINGDFSIWQRGTSFTPSAGVATYTADRWRSVVNSGTTISRQAFTPGTAPVAGYEGQFYLNATITGNNQNYEHVQYIENARTFAGQTVTLSFWARSTVGAQPMGVALYQHFGTGGSPSSLNPVSNTSGTNPFTPTSSWVRYVYTFDVPSVSGKTFGTNNDSYLWVRIGQYTTTATNTSIDYWGVQLEAGSVATAFTTATGTIQGELAACQRYYQILGGDSVFEYFGIGANLSSTEANCVIPLKVTMRVAPTVTASGATNFRVVQGTSSNTGTVAVGDIMTKNTVAFQVQTTGLTLGFANRIIANNTTAATIQFIAEL
jgi:hypothetical protein